MKLPMTALTFTGLLSSSALLAADMHIPMVFEYLALDGQKVPRSLAFHKSDLALAPGYHEIAIRYHDMVETDIEGSQDTVKSTAFIITLNVVGDADYYLKPAGGDTIRNPQEFAEAPAVVITQNDGGSVDYQVTHTDIGQREYKTRLYGKTLSPEAQAEAAAVAAATAAAVASPQLVPQATASAPAAVAVVSAPASTSMGEEDVLSTPVAGSGIADEAGSAGHNATPEEMLQIWWQRADQQARKEFLSWAIKQL